LPILQEMLDTLAYLLEHASSDQERDMFVELTLTVPVRLTNLLPYLSYLMKPLVLALQGGTEQVSQGLRTLELCIDNLTADFLDPTMVPVLRDLMQALNRLLKPIPANRPHANAAVKILGKLGGRTRRFQEVEEQLDYRSTTSETAVHVTIEGKTSKLQLGYLVETADKAVEADLEEYREDGLQVLMVAAMAVLQEVSDLCRLVVHAVLTLSQDGPLAEGNASFLKAMSGLYLACQEPGIKDKALDFVRDFCRRVFASEVARIDTRSGNTKATVEIGRKRYLPLTSAVADCFVDTFAMAKPAQREGLGDLLVSIVSDFREVAAGTTFGGKADGSRSVERMIQSFAHRFAALCHEEDWSRKMAGVAAIKVLVNRTEINRKLLLELEIDFVRAFIFCLRDAPQVAPSSATDVVELIKQLIRTCQGQEDGRARLPKLTETLVIELNSQSELCRTAVHECIELLAEVTGQPIPELIDPAVKSKVLDPDAGPIFSKPLRALPFAMQVGNIDAITYLMNLRPPFLDTSEEFVRLLHEVLALADVDDQSLLNKQPTLKQENWLKTLRVACLGLLRSAMGTADFLSKPNLAPVRSRIIQVYFKHVYSPSPEIVDIAHAGLRDVLEQQSKLPKDVLQAGLRPILVNLADAKRLSVPGLDGLARFLELLTNYFKVEIGVKMLEHFDTLGDAQMLQKAAYSPLDDNPDISRMTRLVNIFRLLPSTAIQYLKSLTSHVVDVEASLHQSAKGPFTENIAKYLDKYHAEGAQNLLDNIQNPRYIWTYRNIIQSGHAPQLVEELSGKAEAICDLCFKNPDEVDLVLPGLYIIRELSRTSPTWFVEQEPVLEALVGVWRSILIRSRDPKGDMSSIHYQQMPPLLLEMFMGFLRQQQHIALLFHVVEAYEIRSSFERSNIAAFLYEQVALQPSIEYRRDVVEQYFNLYEDESVTWAFKINALRLIVNPTVKVYFTDQKADGNDGKLISPQLIHRLDTLVWLPLTVTSQAKLLEDTLLIEIYQFTILLVQHAKDLIDKARKNIFKFAWMGVNILEPTIKLMAYVLTAQFMAILEHPDKFARLTWIGLLRLKDNDNRVLFRRALDTLAPILPTLQNKDHPPPLSGIPEWAQRVRTVLIEEGHATNQLVTVCELLVNHPDIFYPYRELYVPHVANSLNKLAFVQAASPELKKLSVDIVELIFKWEKRRMTARDEAMEVDEGGKRVREKDEAEPSPIKRQRIDRAGTAISASSGGGWAAPSQVRETMTAHLLRLVSSSPEPVARGGLTKRALDLFKEILGPKGLPNVHVKLGYFNRTMTQVSNAAQKVHGAYCRRRSTRDRSTPWPTLLRSSLPSPRSRTRTGCEATSAPSARSLRRLGCLTTRACTRQSRI
jgi:transformation/transcription domain-associated protein